MIRIDMQQWRVYLFGQRLHHGLVGCLMLGFGLVLVAHDRKDFPWL